MSRAAIIKLNIVAAVVAVATLTGWGIIANSPSHKVSIITNSQHQVTQLTYHGQTGQNALSLLKKHADVQTKHYSFGDMVVGINGTTGSGPKYWTFYINGKMADVGAGSYTTKADDIISWKLQ